METDDALKEGAGDGRGGVGVAERDEVRVLGEAVNHREDDGLAAHFGEALDEVHGDVRPHLRRHLERLQHPSRTEGLRLVALARLARAHPIPDQCTIAGDVEVGAEAMEGLLDPLVARRVRHQERLVP